MPQDENDSESVVMSAIDGMEPEEATHRRGGRAERCSVMSEEVTPALELASNDPLRLPTLILEAERAIFNRYLELCLSARSIECSRDIQTLYTS